MSDKKYEVEYNEYTGKYEITEVDNSPVYASKPSTDPTFREKIHEKLDNMGRGGKIFLTFFFNLYGSLFRFSSNTVMGFLIGVGDLIFGKMITVMFLHAFITTIATEGIAAFSLMAPTSTADWFILILCIIPILFWLIDIISILRKDTIVFIGDKKYKNYFEYKQSKHL